MCLHVKLGECKHHTIPISDSTCECKYCTAKKSTELELIVVVALCKIPASSFFLLSKFNGNNENALYVHVFTIKRLESTRSRFITAEAETVT